MIWRRDLHFSQTQHKVHTHTWGGKSPFLPNNPNYSISEALRSGANLGSQAFTAAEVGVLIVFAITLSDL